MNLEILNQAVALGIGATLVMDIWAALLKRLFGVPSLNYALVGRWILHMKDGRFRHNSIAAASPKTGELAVGWLFHYLTGVVFAFFFLMLRGQIWLRTPDVLSALLAGLITVSAPFFIMQPAFGAGVAASKTPQPRTARLRSLMAHSAFGLGLYLSALSIRLISAS